MCQAAVVATVVSVFVCAVPARGQEGASNAADGGDAKRQASASAEASSAVGNGYLGVLYPLEAVDVPSELTAVLRSVDVRLGDQVEAGQRLAVLDDQPLRRELAMADAAHEASRSDVARYELLLQQAQDRWDRRTKLAGALSEEELAELDVEKSLAAADLESARARATEREARVADLRQKLARTEVRAPFAGRVSAVYQNQGTLMSPGQAVVRVISAQRIWVRFAVPRDVPDALVVGGGARVVAEDWTTPRRATVRQIAPEVEPNSDMIVVEAELLDSEDLEGAATSGLVVRVYLDEADAAGR